MSVLCVECQSINEDAANEALHDDYLCQEHRDLVEGAKYCTECSKRFLIANEKSELCKTCASKEKCEYCGKLYSHKRLLAAAKSRVFDKDGKEKFTHHGVRFKGLCNDCASIALGAVPNVAPGHQEVTCPDCNYMWDVKVDEQSLC